jgi:hypothetical protein
MQIALADLRDLLDTNSFLRALWAQMRKEFGKCAWNYQPHKEGEQQLIFLGFVDVGLERTISVSLKYRTKTTLSAVRFAEEFDQPLDAKSELGRRLTAVVRTAMDSRTVPSEFGLQVAVEGLRTTVAPYRGDWFKLEPGPARQMALSLRVRAFDRSDAEAEVLRRLPLVLDVLAVETNHLYWTVGEKRGATVDALRAALVPPEREADDREAEWPEWNTFAEATDWIDEYPRVGRYALISEAACTLLDRLVSGDDLTEDERTFAKACHHFHVAREQDALVYDRVIHLPPEDLRDGRAELSLAEDSRLVSAAEFSRRAEEIAIVLYLSAVEVASTIAAPPTTTCSECGQERYRISARVVDFVITRTPEPGKALMASVFKKHYVARSKYLHAGSVVADQVYVGTTIPLLDPSSESGVTQRTSVLVTNMREWIGHLLRQQIKELAAARTRVSAG